jgi:hypothetical protein
MDVRIYLCVRERCDVDLVLGQGAFNTSWHAHTLTRPGAIPDLRSRADPA